jgi:hypothetical protein
MKMHDEELHDVHFSLHVIQVIKSSRMRWAGHVARRGGGKRGAYTVLVGKAKGRDHFEGLGVGEILMLKCIFNKWDWGMDWIYLAQGR